MARALSRLGDVGLKPQSVICEPGTAPNIVKRCAASALFVGPSLIHGFEGPGSVVPLLSIALDGSRREDPLHCR